MSVHSIRASHLPPDIPVTRSMFPILPLVLVTSSIPLPVIAAIQVSVIVPSSVYSAWSSIVISISSAAFPIDVTISVAAVVFSVSRRHLVKC